MVVISAEANIRDLGQLVHCEAVVLGAQGEAECLRLLCWTAARGKKKLDTW